MHLEEFADLIGCKRTAVQNAELARRQLTEEMAMRISLATNVSFSWLMEGNPAAPIRDRSGNPYTLQSRHTSKLAPPLDPWFYDLYAWTLILRDLFIFAGHFGHTEYVEYKLRATLLPLLVKVGGAATTLPDGSLAEVLCHEIKLGGTAAKRRWENLPQLSPAERLERALSSNAFPAIMSEKFAAFLRHLKDTDKGGFDKVASATVSAFEEMYAKGKELEKETIKEYRKILRQKRSSKQSDT